VFFSVVNNIGCSAFGVNLSQRNCYTWVVNCIRKNSNNAQNVLARSWMQQALLRLLQSHNLSDITVSALTKEAGVARITFYRNYTEMSDVIFDYLEMSHFGVANDENANLYLPQFVRCYFLFFYENFCVGLNTGLISDRR